MFRSRTSKSMLPIIIYSQKCSLFQASTFLKVICLLLTVSSFTSMLFVGVHLIWANQHQLSYQTFHLLTLYPQTITFSIQHHFKEHCKYTSYILCMQEKRNLFSYYFLINWLSTHTLKYKKMLLVLQINISAKITAQLVTSAIFQFA